MAALPYDIHYQGDFFGDRGITVVNNSEVEIADAILEMEAQVTGCWTDSEDQQNLQSVFWASMGDSENVDIIRNRLKIKISSKFLERNRELI